MYLGFKKQMLRSVSYCARAAGLQLSPHREGSTANLCERQERKLHEASSCIQCVE